MVKWENQTREQHETMKMTDFLHWQNTKYVHLSFFTPRTKYPATYCCEFCSMFQRPLTNFVFLFLQQMDEINNFFFPRLISDFLEIFPLDWSAINPIFSSDPLTVFAIFFATFWRISWFPLATYRWYSQTFLSRSSDGFRNISSDRSTNFAFLPATDWRIFRF